MPSPRFMALPRTRQLIVTVRKYANRAGDSHAGWAAISDFWDNDGIGDIIVHEGALTPADAIAALGRAADEIVANRKKVK